MTERKRKFFGTDGIRGHVGEGPVTAEFILKLGWAVGRVLARGGDSKVLIGKDTRISGYMFESALEAGLASAGVDIHLLGPMPTPAIAYLTRTLRAQAGIVISASHNKFADNGIKFFSAAGSKLADDIELAIEEQLEQPFTTVASAELGKAVRLNDAPGRYIEFCKSTFPSYASLNGLKIIVDCAHGATYHVAPSVFTELGAEVIDIGVDPDGLNINEYCGATYPETMRKIVIAEKADLGIAFDGDGDRVIMVDHQGEVVDGDELLFIMAQHLHETKQLHGGVVGTVMSNLGLERALQELNIPFVRSKVGDRYVLEKLNETGWSLGGESSGHIVCLDATTTGDGIISALQVLAAMQNSGKNLHDLKKGMKKYPQTLVNVRMKSQQDPSEYEAVKAVVANATNQLGAKGRLLLRMSGTEPLFRVMVEGEDEQLVLEVAQSIAQVIEQVA